MTFSDNRKLTTDTPNLTTLDNSRRASRDAQVPVTYQILRPSVALYGSVKWLPDISPHLLQTPTIQHLYTPYGPCPGVYM
jgi:hypothetical protein